MTLETTLTLKDIHAMQKIDRTAKTISEWKKELNVYVYKFGLTDRETIELARSWKLPYAEAQELYKKYL